MDVRAADDEKERKMMESEREEKSATVKANKKK